MMQKLRIAKNILSLPLPSGGWVEVEPQYFYDSKFILQKVWITFHHLHLREVLDAKDQHRLHAVVSFRIRNGGYKPREHGNSITALAIESIL